jgi:hypothetical protein
MRRQTGISVAAEDNREKKNAWGEGEDIGKKCEGGRKGRGILANKENPWIWPLDGKKESLEKALRTTRYWPKEK